MNYLFALFQHITITFGTYKLFVALFQHITITVWTFKLFVCIISAYNLYWLDTNYLLALFQDINVTAWTYGLFVCIISGYYHYCLDLRIICLHYFSMQPLLSGPMNYLHFLSIQPLLSGPINYLFALFQHTTITNLDLWIICLHYLSIRGSCKKFCH